LQGGVAVAVGVVLDEDDRREGREERGDYTEVEEEERSGKRRKWRERGIGTGQCWPGGDNQRRK
jgi:hypothetical protein